MTWLSTLNKTDPTNPMKYKQANKKGNPEETEAMQRKRYSSFYLLRTRRKGRKWGGRNRNMN